MKLCPNISTYDESLSGRDWDEHFANLMERIARLPSKGFVVTTHMTGFAFLSGVFLFGEKLKALSGA